MPPDRAYVLRRTNLSCARQHDRTGAVDAERTRGAGAAEPVPGLLLPSREPDLRAVAFPRLGVVPVLQPGDCIRDPTRVGLLGILRPPRRSLATVKARAALPRMRAGEPRASMRACSYHASPGPGQANVLWIELWTIYVNTLVNRSTAVDEGCCGKVDNRCETGSCQVAGLPPSIGRSKVSTGEPRGPLIPCCGRARSSHGGIFGHKRVPMSLDDISYRWWDQAARWGLGWSRRCAWPGRCPGVSPVRPPATGNHCLKGLPVHRGVLFAGCPGQGGRHVASREFPGRIFHAPALE